MISIPAMAAIDGEGRSKIAVRYEDVAQDGRMIVEALATGVNDTFWREALRGHPLEVHAFPKGLLPILTRFVATTGDGPFDVDGTFDSHARFSLAHGVDATGAVNRLYLNGWVDTFAPIGRTNLAPPPNRGERAVVGRSFVEHVFTRPFAPTSERRVTRLDIPGLPEVPTTRYEPTPTTAILELPHGATVHGRPLELDETPVVFGLRHTDSNQHVNSLVYPGLFEEACLRRFARLGLDALDVAVLARSMEVAYRKPCFAGQTARIAMSVFEVEGRLGACGGFYASDEVERVSGTGVAGALPNAFIRMGF